MENLLNEIRVAYMDGEINRILGAIPEDAPSGKFSIRYNANEELFLALDADLFVPRFPIHHDVRVSEPTAGYAGALRDVARQLAECLPGAFKGLTYYFDPAENLKPCFYRLYKVEESVYLYLLRLDLMSRAFECEVLETGTNDVTPAYRTRRLYAESEIIPLDAVMWELGRVKAFKIRQLVSNTWIGESGRGYLVRGIWMDSGLSKFFSRLFLPDGARTYPYYPFFCKYKTICASAPSLNSEWRRRALPLLHRAVAFLTPEMDRIQAALKGADFSETMPEFVELKGRMPAAWREPFKGIASKSYLNERDMKEFSLEIPDL